MKKNEKFLAREIERDQLGRGGDGRWGLEVKKVRGKLHTGQGGGEGQS